MKTLLFNYFVILFAILSLFACLHSEEVESDNSCTSNCTTFTGRIETEDHIGVPNVKIKLFHVSDNMVIVSSKELGETTTDNEGNYNLKVFIDDTYLGYIYRSFFKLSINRLSLCSHLSDSYLKLNKNLDRNPYLTISQIDKRDTIYSNDFIVPKKANLRIKLNNFAPVIQGDFFNVQVLYNYSYLSPDWETYVYDTSFYAGEEVNPSVFETETLLNSTVGIEMTKRINGVYHSSHSTINISTTDWSIIEFDY